tara:strand:+ start:10326 stop:10898 length:573 start_codon:yes stop_codon:yes gene_type:complete
MNRRKKTEIAALREQVGRLYLSKKTQAEIGEVVGLTQQAVSLHIKALRNRWLVSAEIDFSLARAEELAKLDNLELIAHDAWQASHIAKITKTVDVISGNKVKKQTRTEAKQGDSRFLDIVLKCVTKRCELLGVNAPTKIAATTPDGSEPYSMGIVALAAEAARIKSERINAEELAAEEADLVSKKDDEKN